jgi:hypothetical protein
MRILFNLCEIGHEIRFRALDPFGAFDEFPADEEDGKDEDPSLAWLVNCSCVKNRGRDDVESKKVGQGENGKRGKR